MGIADLLRYFICHVLVITFITSAHTAGVFGPVAFCEGEALRAMCSEGEVVLIRRAEYGRMNLGRCLTIDYGSIGCSVGVLPQIDAWCSGRRTCEVRVSSIVDVIRDAPQPCPRDLRSYLEASYECVKVEHRSTGRCPPSGPLVLTKESGYISNLIAETTGVGSIECPWIVRARPGQRLNFTVYDFAFSRRKVMERSSTVEVCSHVFATIKETDVLASKKLCGGVRRLSHAYTSISNSAEVRIFSEGRENDGEYFLLKYEVIGCPDPDTPPGGWVERLGDRATIHCNDSAVSRTLKCNGSVWQGAVLRCDRGTTLFGASPDSYYVRGQEDPGVGEMLLRFMSGTHELSVVIIVTVAMIIALAILIVGLMCLRKRRAIQRPRRPPIPPPPPGRDPGIYYSGARKEPAVASSHAHRARSERSTLPRPPVDQYSSENDYYRTWQMQRHASSNSAHGSSMGRPPSSSPTPFNGAAYGPPGQDFDGTKYTFHPVEHIYESPKFERRDTQYYELDQGLLDPLPLDQEGQSTLPHRSLRS